jgi:hypothetical protein
MTEDLPSVEPLDVETFRAKVLVILVEAERHPLPTGHAVRRISELYSGALKSLAADLSAVTADLRHEQEMFRLERATHDTTFAAYTAEREKVRRVEEIRDELRSPTYEPDQDWLEDPVTCIADALDAALVGEGAAEVTLHADRSLPPELAKALADLTNATVKSVNPPEGPSYAVFVCEQGIIGCRSPGPHREHDLAERPFIRAEDAAGEGAVEQPQQEA